jgi:hypothetical protein
MATGAERLFRMAILHGNIRQKIDAKDSLENKICQIVFVFFEYITACVIVFVGGF